ncbi:MAG: reverse transcriptase domain-containing protein [bacterium]|nr:reverse transcriptase domain-containing protein [bacterium]
MSGGGVNGHDIFEEIISIENLLQAWREFKRGKTNKLEIQEFALNLEDNLFQLHAELKNETYLHSAYTAFYVNDPKLRRIHKALVRDRLLHHAIFRVLYLVFDKHFIHDSYSCRVRKGTHRAVNRLKKFLVQASHNDSRLVYALKCDVRKFFDSIDQDILLEIICRRIYDERAIRLVRQIVGSFEKSPNIGLPLGNVTSQLFANIYLNELDQFAKHCLKAKHYLRYCDDFIILGYSPDALKKIANKIDNFLQERLKLSLHPNKIIIRKYRQGIDFLGYVVLPYHRVLRTKTKKRILKKISMGVNKNSFQSYLGVLSHCAGYKIKRNILNIHLKKARPVIIFSLPPKQ